MSSLFDIINITKSKSHKAEGMHFEFDSWSEEDTKDSSYSRRRGARSNDDDRD